MSRALVLAHEPDGSACQIEARLRERGFEVDTHVITADYDRPQEFEPFPSIDDYDLIVPMGSIRSLTNKAEIDAWIHDELELIRVAQASDVPVLGICFGGQLIADALGGSVENAPVTEIGWYELSDGPDGPNPAGPGPWLEWHHDRFSPPPDAEVLAVNDNAVQMIRIGKTVGTQFHPEIDEAHIKGFLEEASDEYLGQYGVDRHELLAQVREHEADSVEGCHAFVDWYLDEVAFPDGLPA